MQYFIRNLARCASRLYFGSQEATHFKDFLFADDTVLLAKGENVKELTNFFNVEF
jgi:hypothetical protein